jgi:NAD(P)H-nitrite reductase large subunit
MDEKDELICVCNEVWRSTIIKAIQENKLTTAEQIGEITRAGTNCGGCVNQLNDILNALKEK